MYSYDYGNFYEILVTMILLLGKFHLLFSIFSADILCYMTHILLIPLLSECFCSCGL